MTGSLTKIGARVGAVLALLSLIGVAAYASAREPGLTYGTFNFSHNGLDLKIDSYGTYNGKFLPSAYWHLKDLTPGVDKFFNFDDIKPGDFGCEVISMHVKKGDAFLCLDFKNLQSSENGENEPEGQVDSTDGGDLADNLQFFGWVDNKCDGKFKDGERILFGTSTKAASTVLASTTYPIGDSGSGGVCKKGETRCAAMCWCAGILSVDLDTGEMKCDGTQLGNIAQTDSMTVDVSVTAVMASDDPRFLCRKPPKPQWCSHGYWKASQHFDNWVGYSPNQQFSSVFDNAFPGKTLLQVLQQGGGGLNMLGRETVGALLNAGKLTNYAYTQAEVIAMFNAAYPGSSASYNALADQFVFPHNCPLN